MAQSLSPEAAATHEHKNLENKDVPDSSNASVLKPPSPAASSANLDVNGDAALEKAEPVTEPEGPPRSVSGITWALVVLAILSSCFLFALDNTIVADVQPKIVERFNDIQKLPWLSVAFLVSALGTNLFWGKIYGQLNAKWTYVFTLLVFELGSAVCASAPNMNALIVGRALCGVGGAGLYVGVMTLLSVTTTPHERPTYIGMTGLTWGLGTVLGPIIGGAFADSPVTWRFGFWINLIVGGAFSPVYLFLLPTYDPRPNVPYRKRLSELDYLGIILIIGALVSGVMAISFGGITYPWNSGRVIGLFVCSGVLFILFGIQQGLAILTTKELRLFPVEFLRDRTLIMLFIQTSSAVTALFTPIYFIPLFFQFVKSDKALEAGVRLLPFVCMLVFFCLLNGAMMTKYGYYMPWYFVGGILTIIGGALMYTVKVSTSTSTIYGYSILIGIGAGGYCQASFSVAQVKVQPQQIPVAIGFITMAQIGGGTIALAIANAVFLNQSTSKIIQILPTVPIETVRNAIAGAGSSFFNGLEPGVKEQVLAAVVGSIDRVYILVITAGCISTVVAIFMKRERLFLEPGAAA